MEVVCAGRGEDPEKFYHLWLGATCDILLPGEDCNKTLPVSHQDELFSWKNSGKFERQYCTRGPRQPVTISLGGTSPRVTIISPLPPGCGCVGCVAGFTWHLMPPRPVPRPNSPLVTAASLTQLGPGRAGRTGRAGPGPMPVLLTVHCRAPPGELHSSLRNTTLPPPPRGLLEAPQIDRKRISNRVTLEFWRRV